MAKGDGYPKVVAWSDEDKCFISTCPQLMYGGAHGDEASMRCATPNIQTLGPP